MIVNGEHRAGAKISIEFPASGSIRIYSLCR